MKTYKKSNALNLSTRLAFDMSASQYDSHAVLQREVAWRMNERLHDILYTPYIILNVGCATGCSSSLLNMRYQSAKIYNLDFSEKMLHILQAKHRDNKLSKKNNLQAVCADMIKLPFADNSVDLIWSNLALQLFSNIHQAFKEFNRVLKPEGFIMFTTLGIDTLHELTELFIKSNLNPISNCFFDLHNIGDDLLNSGFTNPVMDVEKIILNYPCFDDLLNDLEFSGLYNTKQITDKTLGGKQRNQMLKNNYEKLRNNGKLPATYEIIYGHAWGKK